MKTNYFDSQSIARRYEKGRPYFQGEVILRVREQLNFPSMLPNALDIACGTGLSSKALLTVAEQVYATDISAEMLQVAYLDERIHYQEAKAEQQPFEPGFFDLVTVSSGVHWFDINLFLAETNRVLKPNGWLVIYDSFFAGKMKDVEAFSNWYPDVYGKKFPPPSRNDRYNWTNEHLNEQHFTLFHEESFQQVFEFSLDQLVLYFTTQSNITAQVEQDQLSYEDAEQWLYQELEPFFQGENRSMFFGGWIKYLRKV
ncbi:methyltransferase domain-containing protein [Fluviicola sp.]|uniref:class I SAM-dependent methyltransferase n=1 Tax=Fluviicola sp. TaxID=1917219 RepID=UPI0031E27770